VDPRTFDGMIRRLSRRLSRRSLVGGSLGASLLDAVGIIEPASAEKLKAEACVPAGRRCGTKKKDPACRKCCQRYHIVNARGTKKCACRPANTECTSQSQCCSGICENGTCRAAPCRAVDASCEVNTDCCSNICGCIDLFSPFSVCTCRNATCAPPDSTCASNADCCTELCDNFGSDDPTGICIPP
jgi:hypothetical protein